MSEPAPPDSPRLLLLGWSGADWGVIQPLLDAGRMPHLASVVQRGVMGKLMGLAPLLGPALWASLATGCRSDVHGITAWAKPGPDGQGVEPMGARDLQVPPLWDWVASAGKRACAVGWPMTHPARDTPAVVVSDAFAHARGTSFDTWPVPPGSVCPPALADELAELRLHPSEVEPEQVLPFCPQAARIDQETDERLPKLVACLARAASVHGVGTHLAARGGWDLLAVQFDLIERLSTAFMAYSAPQMPQVSATDHQLYGEVVDGAYQFMDLLLGRYLALVGEDTHVVLVSDHGFLTQGQRPAPGANSQADPPSRAYRPMGILAAAGPSILQDELVFGATLLDIAPTALQLLGLQPPPHMEGQVLQRMFNTPLAAGQPLAELPGAGAARPAALAAPGNAEAEADAVWARYRLAELQAWGDLRPVANNPEAAAEDARIAQLDHTARVKIGRGQHLQALAVLAELRALSPGRGQTLLAQAQCHLALDQLDACRAALDSAQQVGLRGPMLDCLLGRLAWKEGHAPLARDHLLRAEQAGQGVPAVLAEVGEAHLQARDWPAAERSLRACLAAHPEHALGHQGLGLALVGQGRHAQAVEHFRRSIGLLYHRPDAHHHLGLALAATGQWPQALTAFANALKVQPGYAPAQAAMQRAQVAWAAQARQDIQAGADSAAKPP